jgi:hypothetical protein
MSLLHKWAIVLIVGMGSLCVCVVFFRHSKCAGMFS